MKKHRQILFITANRIGDAVLSTGILAYLTSHYRDAEFTIVCGPVAADLFRAVPRLKKLITLKKQPRHGHWRKLWAHCFFTRWDLIVDLRNSAVSRFLFAKKKAYRPPHMTEHHKVEDNAKTLNLSPAPAPHLWLDARAIENAKKIVPEGKIILALGPTANWPAKQWSCFNFIKLAEKLTAATGPLANAMIMIVAAPHEKEQVMPLFRYLPKDRLIKVMAPDLLTVAACLHRAHLFVGNDSGLTHMAAAMDIPTIGLFGPGYDAVYGPWGANAMTVRTEESTEELLERCEYPGINHPNLMTGLSVNTVYESAVSLLQQPE